MAKQEKNDIPKWLKKLQESSWELELLISGGAIFSLFQLTDIFIDWVQNLRMMSHFPGSLAQLMVGMVGIKVLSIGFTLHLIFRAYWLALVCINYVFPSGINEKKVFYRKPFRYEYGEGLNLKSQILKVDRICGITMYLTITTAFAIAGLAVSIIFCFFLLKLFPVLGFELFGNIYLLCLLLYFIDFILFGILRKIPLINYLVFIPFWIFDRLCFRKIYGKSLLLLSSNIHKFKFFIWGLLFVASSIYLAYNSLYRTMHWPNVLDQREYRWSMTESPLFLHDMNYMDNWGESKRSPIMGIESKRLTGDYMEVFVRYDKIADFFIEQNPEGERFLDNTFVIRIDSVIQPEIEWMSTRKKLGRIGISAFANIAAFENGPHVISLHIAENCITEETINLTEGREVIAEIPFLIDRMIFPSPLAKDS